ncbi:SIR2 family protein [uncultured Enterococcus sp.]|uniref:SIR2 family protein n=1 Tax=uncultured Enterococcus sp. TaxID=167972 RepID=UPI002599AC43|nr:SIR2 family protein [uncultured Enterococcus sp.]
MSKQTYLPEFRKIREALENNNLVIFVGAGVSANSGLPSWSELVKVFAEEINYGPYCRSSEKGNYKFSSDELLKIPQYVYDTDTKKYFEIIGHELKNENFFSNPLHKLIVNMLPNHIITTNYDKLLESSGDMNDSQYRVVSSDGMLLSNQGEHYIIKMHGDIDDLENIVLREDDYLNYSNKHILIETFIKSLLVNHVFLFVGYSLNDYNLKQIMSWIDYLSSKESVQNLRHKNYIIQNQKPEEFELKYWRHKNLSIIDSSFLDESLIERFEHADLEHDVGKRLYTCLQIIKDDDLDMSLTDYAAFLKGRYSVFDSMSWINIDDLKVVSGIKDDNYESGSIGFYDERMFRNWVSLSNDPTICDYWNRAGIYSVYYFKDRISEPIEIYRVNDNESILYDLACTFQYEELEKQLVNSDESELVKNYYRSIINISDGELKKYYQMEKNEINQLTRWETLLYKFNEILFKKRVMREGYSKHEVIRYYEMLSKKEKLAYDYLYKIVQSGYDIQKFKKMEDLLLKTENYYENPYAHTNKEFGDLPEIQTIAYHHFLFIRKNGVLIDSYLETKVFFTVYLKALLISQKQIEKKKDILFGFETPLKKYEWCADDVNIFISYSDYSEIKKYIIDHKIPNITFDEETSVTNIFKNFCESTIFCLEKGSKKLFEQLPIFFFLLMHCEVDENDKKQILTSIFEMLAHPTFNDFRGVDPKISISLIKVINYFISQGSKISVDYFVLLLERLGKEAREGHDFLKLISKLKENESFYRNEKIQTTIRQLELEMIHTRERVNFLGLMYPMMSEKQKREYSVLINKNVIILDSGVLLNLIRLDVIHIDESVKREFVQLIDQTIEKRKSGYSSFPDPEKETIEKSIVFYLLGTVDNIEFLKPFTTSSVFLDFIFNYESFDYSKIDFKEYMWVNLFKNDFYREKILIHGKEKIKKNLIKDINNGDAKEEQKKIFFKYIASEEEFWNYS